MQTIKKEQQIQGCLKSTPKHESYIAKIFNYNTQIGVSRLGDHKYECNKITKSLQSVKLQESPILKKCNVMVESIDQTKKKKSQKVMFKTEIDELNPNPLGFSTQRKSYDCVQVEQKMKNSHLRSQVFDMESKNLQQKILIQEKNNRIQQLKQKIEESKQKQKILLLEQSQEEQALLNQVQQIEKQCQIQRNYIQQLPIFEIEVKEWKNKFLQLNRQFHQQQEKLYRIEAEKQSSHRNKTEQFNYFNS